MRGVPRSGLWSEVRVAASGTAASGRKVASVAEWNPPRARVHGTGRSSRRGFRKAKLRTVSPRRLGAVGMKSFKNVPELFDRAKPPTEG